MGALSVFSWLIIGAGLLIVFRAFQRNGAGVAAHAVRGYVVTDWHASDKPDPDGMLVRIRGRRAGLVAYVLHLLRIDPTMSFIVYRDSILFEEGSLSGFVRSVTSLDRVSTSFSGYHKPWRSALVIVLVGLALTVPNALVLPGVFLLPYLLTMLVFVAAAGLYYGLNKRTTIVVCDVGGGARGFQFKRSVIEGKSVDEQAAERIVAIIEMLILGNDRPRALTADASPASLGEVVNMAAREVQGAAARTLQRTADVTAQAHAAMGHAAAKLAAATARPTLGVTGEKSDMKCPDCGATVRSDSAYCGACGRKLD